VVINNLIKPYGLEQILKQARAEAGVALENPQIELADVPSAGPRILLVGSADVPGGHARLDADPDREARRRRAVPGHRSGSGCHDLHVGFHRAAARVVLHHDNIRFAIAGSRSASATRPTTSSGVFLPLSFDYGLYQIFLAAQVGAAVFLGRPEMADLSCCACSKRRRSPSFPGSPRCSPRC
jgi:hypothetical protein